MFHKPYRTPAIPILTILVTLLALIASFGGLFIPDLYNDSDVIKKGWLANDLVTIPFALLTPITLMLQKRGDERPILVWAGLMLYMCYNYAFYLFGAKFNEFFLIYVALFSLSLYSLIIGLLNINIYSVHGSVVFRKRQILISIFLFLLAAPLCIVEIKQCLTFIFSGKTPEVPTLIFALDLSTIVPTTVLASILLWKNRPWGNVLAMIMLVKSFAYGLVLVTGSLIINASEVALQDPLLPFYSALVIGGLVFGWLHLKDLQPSQRSISQRHD
ncbi:MAG: hypothetical protein ACOYXT_10795 [Bacteroidota bacterium]